MSTFTFSAEQAAALETDKHLIVLANAGAGKTFVLTQRFRQLLETTQNAESRIVAITFTKKAAAEMRQRINASANARISTFHSFCLSLLQKYSLLNEHTNVYDESSIVIKGLIQEAIAQTVTYYSTSEHLLPKLTLLYQELQSATFISTISNYIQKFSVFIRVPETQDYSEESYKELKLIVQRQLCIQLLSEITIALQHAGPSVQLSTLFVDTTALLEDLQSNLHHSESLIQAGVTLLDKYFQKNGSRRAKSRFETDEVFEATPDLSSGLYTKLNTLSQPEETGYAVDVYQALYEFSLHAYKNYSQAKSERSIITHDDILVAAYQLLKSTPDVARSEGERILHLMVDEVQDTDPIQFDIISLLVPQLDGKPPFPNASTKVFLVGDNKQSIYSFRGSDVRQFKRMETAIAKANSIEGNLDSGKRTLTASYRMMPSLIHSINDVCRRVFLDPSIDTQHAEYEVEYEELVPGRLDYAHSGTFSTYMYKIETHPSVDEEMCSAAKLIANILNTPEKFKVSDGSALRNPTPSDIAILVKRGTHTHTLEAALARYNIPTYIHSTPLFHTLPEVADCSTLALWLLDTTHSLHLASILRSPMFLCSLADLVQCASLAERSSWFTTLCEARYNIEMSQQLRSAIDILREAEEYFTSHTLVQTVRFILNRTDYYRTRSREINSQDLTNRIEDVLDIIRTAENSPFSSHHDIISVLKQSILGKHQTEPDVQKDAVNVLTIHASKGLEFPIVLLVDISSRDNLDSNPFTPELGITPSLATEFLIPSGTCLQSHRTVSHIHDVNSILANRSSVSEQRRLAYVALTRAVDHVVVLLSENPASNLGKGLLRAIQHVGYEVQDADSIEPSNPIATTTIDQTHINLTHKIYTENVQPIVITATSLLEKDESLSVSRASALGKSSGVEFGTVFHQCMDVLFSAHNSQLNTITLEQLAAIIVPIAKQYPEIDTASLLNEVAIVLQTVVPRFLHFSKILTEIPIAGLWQSSRFSGTVDVCVFHNDYIQIFDWKTNRVHTAENLFELATHYSVQMKLYASMLMNIKDIQRVETNLIFTHALTQDFADSIVTASYTRADIPSLAAYAEDQAHWKL